MESDERRGLVVVAVVIASCLMAFLVVKFTQKVDADCRAAAAQERIAAAVEKLR